jgi:hypothetical protein
MCLSINICLYPHVMMGNHGMKPATFRSGEVMEIYDDICA